VKRLQPLPTCALGGLLFSSSDASDIRLLANEADRAGGCFVEPAQM
jgi:hypothetical protein